jgi:hypothetical protein
MRRAMYLLGHTNPRFTMSVYTQVMDPGSPRVCGFPRSSGPRRARRPDW